MLTTTSTTRFLIVLILLYGTLLIYASLMPFTFNVQVNLHQQLLYKFWSYWPFNPFGRISGSDLLSNLVLYFPLGFLLTTYSALTKNRSTKITILTALAICFSLSMSIEFVQIFIVNRVSSATDLLLNSISGLCGATVGAYLGKRYFNDFINWIQQRWHQWPLDIFTLLLIMLLCADAFAPFLPTIKLSQVWHSLKRSHIDPIGGFSLHPWHWWLMIRILPVHLLTIMLAFWNADDTRKGHWMQAACLTSGIVLGLELIKPMIATRDINVANVIASAIGAFMVLISGAWIRQLSRKNILNLAILCTFSYTLYLGWLPFNFNWNLQAAAHKLPTTIKALLPLYDYAMGATLDHARLFVQNITLSAILIFLLRLRYHTFANNRNRIYFALISGMLIGIMQEGGQLFMLSRTPSMTDIYCFMIGGYLSTKMPHNNKL
ncbi:MAG: hypothetical protein B6I36_02955 [Desulfobacteraceae bacterium 4572_35.1]|nr:MAG: hypothetical protein B6I36_02955 [Desulfobacteraceae bacterium 4572_35.1]